jgi:hypothetical protein
MHDAEMMKKMAVKEALENLVEEMLGIEGQKMGKPMMAEEKMSEMPEKMSEMGEMEDDGEMEDLVEAKKDFFQGRPMEKGKSMMVMQVSAKPAMKPSKKKMMYG